MNVCEHSFQLKICGWMLLCQQITHSENDRMCAERQGETETRNKWTNKRKCDYNEFDVFPCWMLIPHVEIALAEMIPIKSKKRLTRATFQHTIVIVRATFSSFQIKLTLNKWNGFLFIINSIRFYEHELLILRENHFLNIKLYLSWYPWKIQ